jgi:hypothetical protein
MAPSRTVILRKNSVRIFVVPHCEAWLSPFTCGEAFIGMLVNDRLPIHELSQSAAMKADISTILDNSTDHCHNSV